MGDVVVPITWVVCNGCCVEEKSLEDGIYILLKLSEK